MKRSEKSHGTLRGLMSLWVGGLTAAIERMIITEAAEIPVEVQGWGHSLGQAVNLHLMLANDRTSFL